MVCNNISAHSPHHIYTINYSLPFSILLCTVNIAPNNIHHLQISAISLSAKGWAAGHWLYLGSRQAGVEMCFNAHVMMILWQLWPDCLHKLAPCPGCPDHTPPVIKWRAGPTKLVLTCSKNSPGPWSSGHFALLNYASGSGELRTWQPSFNT